MKHTLASFLSILSSCHVLCLTLIFSPTHPCYCPPPFVFNIIIMIITTHTHTENASCQILSFFLHQRFILFIFVRFCKAVFAQFFSAQRSRIRKKIPSSLTVGSRRFLDRILITGRAILSPDGSSFGVGSHP